MTVRENAKLTENV